MNDILNSTMKTLLPLTLAAMVSLPAVASADDDWVPDSHLESVGGKMYWNSNTGIGSALPIVGFLHIEQKMFCSMCNCLWV